MSEPLRAMPPPGGFQPIKVGIDIPKRGPPGWALWGIGFGVMVVGMYASGKSIRRQRAAEHHYQDKLRQAYVLELTRAMKSPVMTEKRQASWALEESRQLAKLEEMGNESPELAARVKDYLKRIGERMEAETGGKWDPSKPIPDYLSHTPLMVPQLFPTARKNRSNERRQHWHPPNQFAFPVPMGKPA